jgi:hypothetical protein
MTASETSMSLFRVEHPGDAALQRAAGGDATEIDAQADQGLRDLGADTRDHHIGAEQAHRLGGPHEGISNLRIHNRHTSDVDDHVGGLSG